MSDRRIGPIDYNRNGEAPIPPPNKITQTVREGKLCPRNWLQLLTPLEMREASSTDGKVTHHSCLEVYNGF
ncbi:MAG TPA: hypothetical protein DD000_13410 [Cyanobacteria bacterium UBA11166]|nr:hypothetical protein [Cyanobacteria bacterium UBA11166]